MSAILASGCYNTYVRQINNNSIVPADNDTNWEDTSTNSITNTTIANKPTSSTHS